MHTQELLLCDVFLTHLACARVVPYQARRQVVQLLPSSSSLSLASAVASCKQLHICACFCVDFQCLSDSSGLIAGLKYKSLDIQKATLLLKSTSLNECWAKENYEENISINMCEHEQNFHALDVAFYSFFSFFIFPHAIGRSYLEFSVFSFFSFLRFVARVLSALWIKHKDLFDVKNSRSFRSQ